MVKKLHQHNNFKLIYLNYVLNKKLYILYFIIIYYFQILMNYLTIMKN